MTQPADGATFLRVRMNGTFGPVNAPYEIWSYGWSCVDISDPGDDFLPAAAHLAAVQAACVAFHSREDTKINQNAILREVALSVCAPDGRQIGETARAAVQVPGQAATTQSHPMQVALAVSLGTGARGASRRGRFYLPAPSVPIFALVDGLPTAASIQPIANSVRVLLTALRAARRPMVVHSAILGNNEVTEVRVGRALDTIRSRRSAMVEGYVTA